MSITKICCLLLCCVTSSTLAQSLPTGLPEVFLPDVVSTGLNERDMAIAPDGKEMFYTIQAPRNGLSVIVHRLSQAGQWGDIEVASFSGQFSDLEAAFSPDGKKLFFVSNRPLKAGGAIKDYDIWYVEKNLKGWSEPMNAGGEINSTEDEYYPSVTSDGSIYFTAVRPDALGKDDIYKSQWFNNQFQRPKNIGPGVNSALSEFNAFIDPDEVYILSPGTIESQK